MISDQHQASLLPLLISALHAQRQPFPIGGGGDVFSCRAFGAYLTAEFRKLVLAANVYFQFPVCSAQLDVVVIDSPRNSIPSLLSRYNAIEPKNRQCGICVIRYVAQPVTNQSDSHSTIIKHVIPPKYSASWIWRDFPQLADEFLTKSLPLNLNQIAAGCV
jgi:hypothetical protein